MEAVEPSRRATCTRSATTAAGAGWRPPRLRVGPGARGAWWRTHRRALVLAAGLGGSPQIWRSQCRPSQEPASSCRCPASSPPCSLHPLAARPAGRWMDKIRMGGGDSDRGERDRWLLGCVLWVEALDGVDDEWWAGSHVINPCATPSQPINTKVVDCVLVECIITHFISIFSPVFSCYLSLIYCFYYFYIFVLYFDFLFSFYFFIF